MKGLWCLRIGQNHVLSSRLFSVARKPDFEVSRKERRKLYQEERNVQKKDPIISCKNEDLNHYKGQSYGKFAVVPLASKGWLHRKSKGDFFEIKNYGEVQTRETSTDTSFQSLGVPDEAIKVLEEMEINEPSPIQVDGIKHILKGHNTLLAAETGSGKTFAYLLPLLKQICTYQSTTPRQKMNSPYAIVITPSRELADQIGENAKLFSECLGINVEVVTGGKTKRMILSPTFKEIDILVASIGALSKLITTGIYDISHVKHIVLDEADTLLDDSFNSKLLYLLHRFSFLPTTGAELQFQKPCVQISLVSATIPTSMNEILGEAIPLDTVHRVTTKHLHCIQPHVPQKFFRLGRSQKPAELLNLVKSSVQRRDPVLIFSNKTATCDWISMFLKENGVKCSNLNGDMNYYFRLGKFREFQSGEVDVLSSTDMGSRGLDTVRVKHLLNYDFPIYMADYIHRCGRTGRYGSPENCHISHFVSGALEIDLVQRIELAVRRGEPLPNVNANIRRIMEHRYNKNNL
ncbi:hypothetical protein R5R35_002025 [Gryllus longicercus]|uniref:RNA helicase n=1 Tax=Gryllus longicercus TaxID=2509291 RepID=A0AAN9V919_9ORTH